MGIVLDVATKLFFMKTNEHYIFSITLVVDSNNIYQCQSMRGVVCTRYCMGMSLCIPSYHVSLFVYIHTTQRFREHVAITCLELKEGSFRQLICRHPKIPVYQAKLTDAEPYTFE